jgi:hypothetical protein
MWCIWLSETLKQKVETRMLTERGLSSFWFTFRHTVWDQVHLAIVAQTMTYGFSLKQKVETRMLYIFIHMQLHLKSISHSLSHNCQMIHDRRVDLHWCWGRLVSSNL